MTEIKVSQPLSSNDYYSKTNVAQFILEKSAPTVKKWEEEGKIFSPRFTKSDASNARKYYTIADAMKLSIMLYGSIHMEKIYDLILFQHYGLKDDNKIFFLNNNGFTLGQLKKEIRESFQLIKSQISNKIEDPVDLSKFIEGE